ncbi:hypothetical protein E5288_WYG003197 [Bos mutus]|uniref:Uncharacterized protein n=1 Tax=Bos mutus TaxID=72004 RepID=A0A6B0R858_9CETA|nr:hypothetical protein [Bos mutus]
MVSKSKTSPTQDPAVPFQVKLLTNGQRCTDVHSGIALWLKQPGSPRQQESETLGGCGCPLEEGPQAESSQAKDQQGPLNSLQAPGSWLTLFHRKSEDRQELVS